MVISLSKPFTEVLQYREVLSNLVSQHLKVKYKRSALGYLWSLLNPILQLAVLSVVFSHMVHLGMRDYSMYLFSGLLTWNFFSATLMSCSTVLLESESYLKKVYLPKILFPISRLCFAGVDMVFALVALMIIGVFMGYHFSATVLLLPPALLILGTFSLGMGIILSVATVFFRDVGHLLGVVLQLLYFATPLLYPLSTVPERLQKYLVLNPFYTQLVLFQKIIYFREVPTLQEWAIATGVAVLTLVAGVKLLSAAEDEIIFRI